MTRFCSGPTCRDLTPVLLGRGVCDQCYGAAVRARHREESRRHMQKPEKRAAKLAANRLWWKEHGAARRKAAGRSA